MLVYHGTPCGGVRDHVPNFLRNRHALIPFPRPEDLATALDVCQSVIADNGAFTAWKAGKPVQDWQPYYDWLETFYRHPAFHWAIIPDVIDGTEKENDDLLDEWPGHIEAAPVWHLHESLSRLERLIAWPRICLGSSGDFKTPGSLRWSKRMDEAMRVICDSDGVPKTRIHGLRMASKKLICKYPFASVDSTNAVRNSRQNDRFGYYPAPVRSQNAAQIAFGMEYAQTTGRYSLLLNDKELWGDDGLH